jgi:hypothetical protein
VSINCFPIFQNAIRSRHSDIAVEGERVAAVDVAIASSVEGHVKLVFDQLNEKHRRWVAGVLSEVVGYGGTKWVSQVSGVDPKTVRQGRLDLQAGLSDCPRDRVRRSGGGRPLLKKGSTS